MPPQPIRISLPHLLLLALLPLHAASTASTARIGVFTLFHPQELEFTPDSATLVYLTSNGLASRFPVASSIRIRLSEGRLECDIEDQTITADKLELSPRGGQLHFAHPGQEPPPNITLRRPDSTLTVPAFTLAVPGKIRRRYQGALEITPSGSELTAVVSMTTEIAVASIIAAEAAPQAAPAALRAQAVVTRSYLLASPRRHAAYDFCDTTHCQYLRAPPPPAHPAAQAAQGASFLEILATYLPATEVTLPAQIFPIHPAPPIR